MKLGRLGVPFVIVVVGVLVTVGLSVALGPTGDHDWVKPYCLQPEECGCLDTSCTGSGRSKEDVRKDQLAVAAQRLKNYQGDLGALQQNLWLQLTLTVFAIVVLRRERDDKPLKIPVLQIDVPLAWCHLLIPIALAYLFVTLGFLFDHLIQERYLLWEELAQLEAPRSGRSIHSMRMLLEERWVMDSWFAEFHADHSALSMHAVGATRFNQLLLFLFALFVAMQHALSLFLLSRRDFPGGTPGAVVCLVLVVVVLGFSHFGFRVFGGNPNWVQAFVAGFTILILAPLTMRFPPGWGARRTIVDELARAAAAAHRETERARRASAERAWLLEEEERAG
jgi:hypothetical protein